MLLLKILKNQLNTFIIVSLICASHSLLAAPYVAAAGGLVYGAVATKSSTFPVGREQPPQTLSYVNSRKANGQYSYALELGWQQALSATETWSVGLEYFAVPFSLSKGHVLNEGGHDFNYRFYNKTAAYFIHSQLVFILHQNPQHWYQKIHPFVSAELGLVTNNAFDYKVTPVNSGQTGGPSFANKVKQQLAYGLGIGLQNNFTQHYALSIALHYLNLGQPELGASDVATVKIAGRPFMPLSLQARFIYTL